MHVNVKLYATLRQFAPPGTAIGESFEVELQHGRISDIIARLRFPPDQARIIFVNGVRTFDLNQKLSDDDLVVFFPPVGGGSS
ncbi:MAG: molybdopterin synthase sulfur carrier subunit [Candidatus Thorarchaeota archaeon]|nr:MAG: molybdopterin synthase sulfur carrier subunit [Candidatus Thorarchaeota archaeon]